MSIQAPYGATIPPPPPPKPKPVYLVERGDTLHSIAAHCHVTVEALQQANPQIRNPDVLYPGQSIELPSQAAPAAAEPAPSAPASHTSTQSKLNGSLTLGGGQGQAGVTRQTQTTTTDGDGNESTSGRSSTGALGFNPGDGTVSLTGGAGFSQAVKTSKGVGLSFGISGNATLTGGEVTKNGTTTYTAAADVSVSLNAGASFKQAGVQVGYTQGIKGSYQVAMPAQAAQHADLLKINPFDPSSMPVGTKITMNGSDYNSTAFEATFRNLAVQTHITHAKGVSTVIDKTGSHTVSVTTGPTQAINAYNGFGVDFDVAKAMLGRSDALDGATLKTAQFDLSTPQGKAAFNDYLANGNLPKNDGAGISNVSTTQKVDYSSQTQLSASLGPLSVTLNGAKDSASWITTSYPDGSSSATCNLQYGGNIPLAITTKLDPSGHEILADRRYTYTIKADANIAQMLNVAQSGNLRQAESGPVKAGQTVTLSYTQAQMQQLMQDAQGAVKGSSMPPMSLQALTENYDGKFDNNPEDFALGLARNLGGDDYGSANRLYDIAMWASSKDGRPQGFTALPGTLTTSG